MVLELQHTMTIAEAARRAGVHGNTVRWWIGQGRLIAVSTPLGRVVDRDSLDEVIRMRAERSAAHGELIAR